MAAVQQRERRLRDVMPEAAPAHAHACVFDIVRDSQRIDARDQAQGVILRLGIENGMGIKHGRIVTDRRSMRI